MKIAPDAIDCDYRRNVRGVAGMAGISKYTAQHTLTSDFSMSHMNSIECLTILLIYASHKGNDVLFCFRHYYDVYRRSCDVSFRRSCIHGVL